MEYNTGLSKMINLKQLLSNQLVRYFIVGGSIGIVFLLIGYILRISGWQFYSSTLLSYLLTSPLSFMGQKNIVFRVSAEAGLQIVRFIVVSVVVLMVSTAIQNIIYTPGISAQFLVWAVVSVVNYLAYRLYVFK